MRSISPFIYPLLAVVALGCGSDPEEQNPAGGASSTGGSAPLGTGGAAGGGNTGGAASGSGGEPSGTGGGIGSGGIGSPGTGGVSSGGGTGGDVGADGGSSSGGAGVFVGGMDAPVSPFIVVDQFGYLPDGNKFAVLRDPQTGFDANESFTPSTEYALVDAATGYTAHTGAPAPWNNGATDAASGDRAWIFDFSAAAGPGEYFVLDIENQVRSYTFTIADDVYREVLRHVLRMFFYQRVGQEKAAQYAGQGWADGASHVGAGQDHDCRLFSDTSNAATSRDLWGGWYDAGDMNKYTIWTSGYVQNLLRAYEQNPAVWTDDINIPESGNGIPDIIDEALFGLDHLTRLQETNGSFLSIVGETGASPPSSSTGPCRYGPATTSATFAAAAAMASAARVLPQVTGANLGSVATDALDRAERAWTWGVANPLVTFRNNEGASAGLGAGQQETDDYGRLVHKLDAAGQLFSATGESTYSGFFDANYTQLNLFTAGNSVEPWHILGQDAALDYINADGATTATVNAIKTAYVTGIKSGANLGAIAGDPYAAPIPAYTWGTNAIKAHMGNNFLNVNVFGLDPGSETEMMNAAEAYIHHMHGQNPLSLVYITNMYDYGAENCANEIYHDWFKDGSAQWDRNGTSTYGPPPGFIPGGPNPYYECGDTSAACDAAGLTPPLGQPPQKSYKDFNAGWPQGSWSVTEPSNGYQVAFLRLLSKFTR